MSTTRLAAYGMAITVPSGWDAEIFLRSHDDAPTAEQAVMAPVLHATNFALPMGRGDFGSAAVEAMGRRAVLLAIIEYEAAAARTPLFDHPFPTALTAREFGPNNLQRPLPGQAGAQRFVTAQNRAFCVYAVIGSYAMREVLVPELNRALATVEIMPVG